MGCLQSYPHSDPSNESKKQPKSIIHKFSKNRDNENYHSIQNINKEIVMDSSLDTTQQPQKLFDIDEELSKLDSSIVRDVSVSLEPEIRNINITDNEKSPLGTNDNYATYNSIERHNIIDEHQIKVFDSDTKIIELNIEESSAIIKESTDLVQTNNNHETTNLTTDEYIMVDECSTIALSYTNPISGMIEKDIILEESLASSDNIIIKTSHLMNDLDFQEENHDKSVVKGIEDVNNENEESLNTISSDWDDRYLILKKGKIIAYRKIKSGSGTGKQNILQKASTIYLTNKTVEKNFNSLSLTILDNDVSIITVRCSDIRSFREWSKLLAVHIKFANDI